MAQYEVATEAVSGVKLPHMFKCPKCNRNCFLLRDDSSIYVDGSTVKKHLCGDVEKAPESSPIAWW